MLWHVSWLITESKEPSEQNHEGKENPLPTEGACGTTADEKQGDCSGMHEELTYSNQFLLLTIDLVYVIG